MGIPIEPECVDAKQLNRETSLNFYIQALEKQVKEYIEKFFAGRSFHCGGPIPKNLLFSAQSIDMVLSTDFLSGVDQIQEALQAQEPPNDFDQKLIEYDTYRLLGLLEETRKFGIPKELQCGIAMLYLKFCNGVILPEKKRDLSHLIN